MVHCVFGGVIVNELFDKTRHTFSILLIIILSLASVFRQRLVFFGVCCLPEFDNENQQNACHGERAA